MDVFDSLSVGAVLHLQWHDFGERRRIIDAVKERGWELVPHNWAQNDLQTNYAHNPSRNAP